MARGRITIHVEGLPEVRSAIEALETDLQEALSCLDRLVMDHSTECDPFDARDGGKLECGLSAEQLLEDGRCQTRLSHLMLVAHGVRRRHNAHYDGDTDG